MPEAAKHIQLAKVEVIKGRAQPKVIQLYDERYSAIEFAPEVIVFGDKIYNLKFPLYCSMDAKKGKVKIENEMLGIYASGNNTEEAEQMFSEEFDYLYNRYNNLPDDELTDDVKAIKSFLNHIVKK